MWQRPTYCLFVKGNRHWHIWDLALSLVHKFKQCTMSRHSGLVVFRSLSYSSSKRCRPVPGHIAVNWTHIYGRLVEVSWQEPANTTQIPQVWDTKNSRWLNLSERHTHCKESQAKMRQRVFQSKIKVSEFESLSILNYYMDATTRHLYIMLLFLH